MDKKKAKLQDKINKVTAELNYWERRKTRAMQEKVRGGNDHDGH